jgi:RNA polymerase sigma-70 factor (ECF subfamily)
MEADVELLDRWRAGENAAGEALFARHFDSLCGFFSTKCHGEADELVQRTLLACLRAKHQFRKESSFRTYLFTVARHELYHHLRQRRRDSERLDFSITSVAELVTTPATRLARDAERRRMLEALRSLPVETQTLLELHYWQELDSEALAEVFETSAATIRVRLHRARRSLRERLEAPGAVASTPQLPRRPEQHAPSPVHHRTTGTP